MGSFLIELPTRRATVRLGKEIARHLLPGDLLLLNGPLGAGKTFLTRAIVRGLGAEAMRRVTSPTFALVQEHLTARATLLHADLYRLLDTSADQLAREVANLGVVEQRAEGAIVVAEWAEMAADALGGEPLLRVTLTARARSSRRAELAGRHADRVAAALAAGT